MHLRSQASIPPLFATSINCVSLPTMMVMRRSPGHKYLNRAQFIEAMPPIRARPGGEKEPRSQDHVVVVVIIVLIHGISLCLVLG